jgi:hypothetical protein
MPPAEFEPTIPASGRPHTHALDRAATGIGHLTYRPAKHATENLVKFSVRLDTTPSRCIGSETVVPYIDYGSRWRGK